MKHVIYSILALVFFETPGVFGQTQPRSINVQNAGTVNNQQLNIRAAANATPVASPAEAAPKAATLPALKQNGSVQNARISSALKNLTFMNQPAEITEASNSRKFETTEKKSTVSKTISRDCSVVPINLKTSSDQFRLFFPTRTYRDAIFPGAIYQLGTLRSQNPLPYTRFTNRNAMDLTIKMFDSRVVPNSGPVEVSTYDVGSFNRIWSANIAKYNSGAGVQLPVTEVFVVESNRQLNTALNTAGQIDFASKLVVPIPDLLINIDAAGKVFAANNTLNENARKNTVLLCFKQVFFSASMSPKAVVPHVFAGVDKAQLESDLVYVQGVDYGQVFYVAVTSSYRKEDLLEAIEKTIRIAAPSLGMQLPAASDLPGLLSDAKNNQAVGETERILNDPDVVVKSYQYDGQPISLGSTIKEMITGLSRKRAKVFTEATIYAPISYRLNFVADHSPGWLNSNVSYATTNCGAKLDDVVYDISLELTSIRAPKVVEFMNDDAEDLFGNLKMTGFELEGKTLMTERIFYETKLTDSATLKAFEQKETFLNISKPLGAGISYQAIATGKIFLTGKLSDDNLVVAPYQCKQCKDAPMEVRLANLIEQIRAIKPGTASPLPLYIYLDFYERGDEKSSHVVATWTIKITARRPFD